MLPFLHFLEIKMENTTVIYEDKNIIVCEKNTGIHSEEKENADNMVDFIREHKKKNGEDTYVGIVHRLDVSTGGVILYAKNKKAAALYSAIVTDKDKFSKEYYAVVHNEPENKKGILVDFLFKDSKKNKSFVVKKQRKGVKEASLEYEVADTFESENKKLSLLKIKLHTGRTHQIRVQFSHIGCPLVGDGKYGSKDNKCDTSLWAYKLTVENPFTKKTDVFSSMPDFSEYPWNLFDMKGN